jgi:ketosteroid isomerase-like protein
MTIESENVALVRAIIESFGAGDLDFPFAHYHPDIVWENFSPAPAGMEDVYEGHGGVRRFWRQWLASWERVEFEQQRYIDAGENVVVFQRMHARGRTSGLETEFTDYAQLWTIRHGKVVRMKFYADREEALAAAGVAEPAD